MEVELLIQNGGTVYYPAVLDGVKLTWERRGVPGRLDFRVVKDAKLNFQEGNPVRLTVDGVPLFYGFVFTKRRDKGRTIDVTAYDQLRYLKNKDTVTEEGLKASELLQRLAADFRLNLGEVEDTGYVIDTIVEENQTLFDMLQNAFDETLQHTGQLFVLYDAVGRLTLQNIHSMRLDLLIDAETAENFDYTSSIDEQTYNKISLSFEDEQTGKRERFVAQDGEKMNQWGVLQYHESLRTDTGAAAKAEALLKLYDRKTRRLTIRNALGDLRVRAGSAVMISLDLGDIIAKQFMLVEKVTHSFSADKHLMELTVIGGDFIG